MFNMFSHYVTGYVEVMQHRRTERVVRSLPAYIRPADTRNGIASSPAKRSDETLPRHREEKEAL
ncbi:hypothetical protein [Chelativorans salis]|uniref:Uncharacterized protein n=1 Tax=Chelativorans salis TaxID=2978478 RepID=A0ABT2LPC1_9HYPH|nr:hypothetical protein [Chelativorans sp. EGI FJ00035]MCT7375243.1 hypothetical protein [Chelativorans sp. EGI FJ00035]